MQGKNFDWLTDEFMLYCRSTQLREKTMSSPRRDTPGGVYLSAIHKTIIPGMVLADTRGRVSLRIFSLFRHHPFLWIVIDVFPSLVIILLVADHMIVISGLPDVLAVFLVAKPFECSHKSCNHGCPGRRDTPPGVFDLFVD